MPASKHMVILGKRRNIGKQALMLGSTFGSKPGPRRRAVENEAPAPRSRGEELPVSRET